MPHPEQEHALQIALATALRERDTLNDRLNIVVVQRNEARTALAAANAKADAAIAEIVNEQRRFGEVQAEAWKLEEALAAARREIGLLTRIAQRRAGHGHDCDTCRKHVAEAYDVLDALAAPAAAAGEDSK